MNFPAEFFQDELPEGFQIASLHILESQIILKRGHHTNETKT